MQMKRHNCPSCGGHIGWEDKWYFSTWLGFRKVGKCPKCMTPLIWAKKPWMIVNVAGMISLIWIISMNIWFRYTTHEFTEADFFAVIWIIMAFVIIHTVILLYGVFTSHFEIVDEQISN